MPELPEVETALRDLEPLLRGRSVVAAQVNWPRTIAAPAEELFRARLTGQRFARFERRGKYMLFGLERVMGSPDKGAGDWLVVHLRMTGQLALHPPAGDALLHENSLTVDPHTHVILTLDDGSSLHFRDPRKFGRLWLVEEPSMVLGRLGPEPDDPAFDVQWLAARLAGRRAAIKALLLDQTICAGIGNIYADEVLFAARIHPARPGGSLAIDEVGRLHEAIHEVLARAIGRGGSSLGRGSTNYRRPGGEAGEFQEEHRVFRRTGQPCPVCGAPVERIVIAQRSTHFCPSCQADGNQK